MYGEGGQKWQSLERQKKAGLGVKQESFWRSEAREFLGGQPLSRTKCWQRVKGEDLERVPVGSNV